MSGAGLRDSLRLAATVTVVNGFTHLFDGAFGYYASMAVLSVSVGYSVCCFMVVMGWLSHEQDLFSWIQLRLVWTAFGILMALVSLRLLWPARTRIQQR